MSPDHHKGDWTRHGGGSIVGNNARPSNWRNDNDFHAAGHAAI